MTTKNNEEPEGDDSLGVLDDTASSDTIAIGLHEGTAQVSVSLPTGGEDDDLVDDEAVDDEVIGGDVVSDLIIDTSAVADADLLARISRQEPEIVIELPAEELPEPAAPVPDEVAEAEIVDEQGAADPAEVDSAIVDATVLAAPVVDEIAEAQTAKPKSAAKPESAAKPKSAASVTSQVTKPEPEASDLGDSAPTQSAQPATPTEPAKPAKATKPATPADATRPATRETAPAEVGTSPESASAPADVDASGLSLLESAVAAAKAELREAMSPARSQAENEIRPTSTATTEETHPVATDDRGPAAGPESQSIRPSAEPARPTAEIALTSKRLDDLGDSGRESADLLTADRLLDPAWITRPEPEGTWGHLLYTVSGGRINVGDNRRARERKALSARIAAPMSGSARFIPVLSRKGGVGKTTVTALLGMALADARDDRVIAVDANPDRGTLAERVVGSHAKSVRDLVRAQHDIRGFHDISALVARDETRLDVLASDADPRVSEAFGDADYRDVAAVAAQYYSIVLTDSGTGIVHSVMGATLDLADQLVIVSGLSVDEARLASETLTWLETNGHAQLARDAIVVLNQSASGTPLVRLGELEAHFATRAKHVLRIPYDPQIAGGGPIDFASLQPETRRAAREIAATLVEGLRAKAA